MNVHIAISATLLAVVVQLCCANDPNGYYTNRFMVQVDGDSEMAEKLAGALGMKSMGHVSVQSLNLSQIYYTEKTKFIVFVS